MLQLRLKGKYPLKVTNQVGTKEQVVSGAIDKLIAFLETLTGFKGFIKRYEL